MRTLLEPVGPEIKWLRNSDAAEITHTASGLRVVLAAAGIDRYFEVHFPNVHAFQVMDEGDMLKYWQPPLGTKHAIYKVLSGGWLERASGHYFQVTSAMGPTQEWLVASDAFCVTAISSATPHFREFGDAS